MEGLESGPMTSSTSDPLLSAALPSGSPQSNQTQDAFRRHVQDDSCFTGHGGRASPHSQNASSTAASNVGFSQYTTLTPLQPLPPISTVTNSAEKFVRSSSPSASEASAGSTPTNLFFQQAPTSSIPGSLNFGSFAYNVNIKYVYDMKNEPEAEDPQSVTESNGRTTGDYATTVTLHQQLHQLSAEPPFSPTQPSYVTSYNGVLEPKQEKIEFISSTSYNTFNAPSDILEPAPVEAAKRVRFSLSFFIG